MATNSRTFHSVAAGLVAGSVCAAVLSACGGSAKTSASSVSSVATSVTRSQSAAQSAAPSVSRASDITIHISNFKYGVPATVQPGQTVQVMNMDGEAHTVTADSTGGFDVNVGGGAVASFKAPTRAGSYPFHCMYHGNMHGVLVVK